MDLEEIKIRCIRSYDGLTLAFDSKDCYDLYYLYKQQGINVEILVRTKDFIVSHPEIKEGEAYYVIGYKIENGEYVMKAHSHNYICEPIEKVAPTGKPKISIVCPVYKAETCIANCLDSILLSTQDDLEVICVDDDSPDRSSEVIHWYEEAYPGIIKYYHQENQGVSFARNKGIELATGEYIALIDNDDFVHPRMYEELLIAAEETGCPIAIGKTIIKDPNGNSSIVLDIPNENNLRYFVTPYDEMMQLKNKCDCHNIFFVAVWHKIIKADLVKAHPFPKSNHYEDTAYTRMIYSYIDNFAFSFDAYYVWDQRRRNTVGTATTYNYERKSDDVYEIHKKFFDANFFGYEAGNKDRIDWLSYDLIKEVYDYLKKTNSLDPNNDLNKIVKKQIKDHFGLLYLENNPHIKLDQELLEYIKKIEK